MFGGLFNQLGAADTKIQRSLDPMAKGPPEPLTAWDYILAGAGRRMREGRMRGGSDFEMPSAPAMPLPQLPGGIPPLPGKVAQAQLLPLALAQLPSLFAQQQRRNPLQVINFGMRR